MNDDPDTLPPAPLPPVPGLRSTKRSLPIALLRGREAVMGPIREMLGKTPLNEQKWRVLRILHENGPMEQTAIAGAACLLLPSLTRILHSMQQDGFVARRTDAGDRRKSIVTITDRGLDLIRQHAAESAAISARLEQAFGADRLNLLLDLLEDLRQTDLTAPSQPHARD